MHCQGRTMMKGNYENAGGEVATDLDKGRDGEEMQREDQQHELQVANMNSLIQA